ncbi:MAG: hypothetical protein ACRDWW_01580 [Acidimicrobiales bacterium]
MWDFAHSIDRHVKTLDSLHVATCHEVGATLLTRDVGMESIASYLGIALR